jgi:hypothetical protein
MRERPTTAMSEHWQTIHDAIQASAEGNESLDDAVLIGWVVVSEWVSGGGTRSLVRLSGTPDGAVPPNWQTRGYLHEALFGRWDGDR